MSLYLVFYGDWVPHDVDLADVGPLVFWLEVAESQQVQSVTQYLFCMYVFVFAAFQ